jgi:hypothetical protein
MGLTLLSARQLDMYFFSAFFPLLTHLRVWQDNCNNPHFLSAHQLPQVVALTWHFSAIIDGSRDDGGR